MGQLQVDLSNSLVPSLGFTPLRWRVASLEAGRQIAKRDLTKAEEKEVLKAAEVAMGIGEFYPGVLETLKSLKEAEVPMGLLTKGERAKQQEKIDGLNLRRFFDKITICECKDAALLQKISKEWDFEDPTVIGDSEASDILPAETCGMRAILIDRGLFRWSVERHEEAVDAPHVSSIGAAVLSLLES